ncbi:fused (3R)-hydroxyacyl-ACP dehydratase subunits HadA/HadB [Antrihabitans stalactiti]|uniref:(R)-hydratase n=1 Tax=Antrihabitans stalactiti TaxID=2584121 RepID=A0A848KBX4_9NOCA|nr:fused (3R)-hydroxyacyl-ACP dehydratase subunits HadA/HadB [Antrihabitans stalactiti]NMN94212.1 (R)-hydratase [Antrihabitans stalactiti]
MENLTIDSAALVGRGYRMVDYYEVGREKIREFARAVQDFQPAHWSEDAAADLGYDRLIAPVTFGSIIFMIVNRALFDGLAGYDMSQLLQADQILELHRPVAAGDRLVCSVELSSFRRVADNDFIVVKNVLATQDNELVQVSHTTVVARTGDEVDPAIAEAAESVVMHGVSLADRLSATDGAKLIETVEAPQIAPATHIPRTSMRFEDLSVGDVLPSKPLRVSRGDLVNYAGVAGDPNPIHWNDGLAALVGLPNVVAHGMLTMGMAAGFVTSWLGDPAALTKFSVRFTGIAPIDPHKPQAIEFTGRIKSLDADKRTAVVALAAHYEERKLFGRATAEVRLR